MREWLAWCRKVVQLTRCSVYEQRNGEWDSMMSAREGGATVSPPPLLAPSSANPYLARLAWRFERAEGLFGVASSLVRFAYRQGS